MVKKILYNKLVQNIGVYTISNIINASIPFLLLPVLTRFLTTNEYGIIATFQSLIGFFIFFIGLNTQTAVIRRYYDVDKVDFSKYISTCIIILLASTLFLIILLIPLSPYISQLAEFPHSWFWTIIVTVFFQYLFTILLGIWQANGKVYRYAFFQNSQALLNMAISIFLVVLLQMGWQGRVIAQTTSLIFFGIIALVYMKKMGLLKMRLDKKYLVDALKFSLPLIPYSFTGWVLFTMDRIFINNMVGLNETGLYAVAFQICMIITLFQQSFNNAWVPWFYERIRKNDGQLNLKIVKFSYTYIVSNFLFALLLVLIGPPFLKIFLGKDFFQATEFLWWLALAQAANAIHVITVSYINLHNKNIYLTYSAIFTAVVHIPLIYLLIKLNGTIGAAQALFISNVLTSLVTFFLAAKFHKMPWLLRYAEKQPSG